MTIENSNLDASKSVNGMVCAYCSNSLIDQTKIINSTINYIGNAVNGKVGTVAGIMWNGKIRKVSSQGQILNFNTRIGGLVGQKASFGRTIESFSDVDIQIGAKKHL